MSIRFKLPPGGDDSAAPLFVDDEELRQRINPRIGKDRFRATIKTVEIDGFPKIHTLWGGRYWPAVKAWLDDSMGLANNGGFVGDAQDGPEHFDAPERQGSRPEARTEQSALLDRGQRRARHDGLPGQVHRIAARRQ